MSRMVLPTWAFHAVPLTDCTAAFLLSIFTLPMPSDVTSGPLGQVAVK